MKSTRKWCRIKIISPARGAGRRIRRLKGRRGAVDGEKGGKKIGAGKRLGAYLARGAYYLWLAAVSAGTLCIIIYALFLKTSLM